MISSYRRGEPPSRKREEEMVSRAPKKQEKIGSLKKVSLQPSLFTFFGRQRTEPPRPGLAGDGDDDGMDGGLGGIAMGAGEVAVFGAAERSGDTGGGRKGTEGGWGERPAASRVPGLPPPPPRPAVRGGKRRLSVSAASEGDSDSDFVAIRPRRFKSPPPKAPSPPKPSKKARVVLPKETTMAIDLRCSAAAGAAAQAPAASSLYGLGVELCVLPKGPVMPEKVCRSVEPWRPHRVDRARCSGAYVEVEGMTELALEGKFACVLARPENVQDLVLARRFLRTAVASGGFLWVVVWPESKPLMPWLLRKTSQWGLAYVENLCIWHASVNNQPGGWGGGGDPAVPHAFPFRSEKTTVVVFRKEEDPGEPMPLRHQRSPDVIRAVDHPEGRRHALPERLYETIETMLPSGRLVELWATSAPDPMVRRRWTAVAAVPSHRTGLPEESIVF